MKSCSVIGCIRPYYAKTFCNLHWNRNNKYGTPDGGDTNHAPPEVRFMRGVQKSDGCWLYVRGGRRGKYGLFQAGGKGSPTVGAHRFSYEMHKGPIPDGLIVMHTCDVPRCVNPDHLVAGTYKENMADMHAKGRNVNLAGEAAPSATLKESQVLWIRENYKKIKQKVMATQLGVTKSAVNSVIHARTWKHLL